MHRLWIALAVVVGAVLGFVMTFALGVEATSAGECDGPCFDKWDEVSYFAYAAAVLGGLLFGLAARSVTRRKPIGSNENRTSQ